jgi:hypothetical protein
VRGSRDEAARVESPAASTETDAAPSPTVDPESVAGGFQLAGLRVPEFLDAVVAIPSNPAPLPVVVATHGAGGDPEWTCDAWGNRLRGRAFILCPRGKAISARNSWGYFYPDHFALEKEVLAALIALHAAFPQRVVQGPMLYTAYSQGATMGALFVPGHAERFPFLILTEGGFDSWSRASAKKFALGGGRRVLFVCGGTGCRDRAKRAAGMLTAAGVETRVEHVAGGGHTDGGRVGERLDEVYSWALGDPSGRSETTAESH